MYQTKARALHYAGYSPKQIVDELNKIIDPVTRPSKKEFTLEKIIGYLKGLKQKPLVLDNGELTCMKGDLQNAKDN